MRQAPVQASQSVCLQLRGSPTVEAANEKFTATMTNEVRWGAQPASELRELRSNTSIQVRRPSSVLKTPSMHARLPSYPSGAPMQVKGTLRYAPGVHRK